MFLGTLTASLLENLLKSRGVITTGEGATSTSKVSIQAKETKNFI